MALTRMKERAGLGSLIIMCMIVVGCDTRENHAIRIAKIAAILPISGSNAAQGIGMMNSCRAAIKDLNASGKVPGILLELMELDDESRPEVAVRAAERAAQDPTVYAVTAHWNSGCALATNPIFHKNGLANLVPAAINSKITLEQLGDEIFRIDPHDLIIVEYAAEFASKVMNLDTSFIIDDNTFYGKELARKFNDEYIRRGGKVLGQDSIQVGERDFGALLTKVKGLSPKVIFFGGVVAEASLIRRQMKSLGLSAEFVSLTGIHTDSFIAAAGPAAEGTYCVTVVPPIELLPGGLRFVESYNKNGFNHPYEAWGVFGYASIEVLAEAIRRTTSNLSRRNVVEELKRGEFDTVLGKMQFDKNGQTTLIMIWVYQVRDNRWGPIYSADGKGGLLSFEK